MEEIVFAGIVLFNPSIDRLKENIGAISKQISTIICVDNGSSNKQDIVDIISHYSGISVIWNEKNVGMAKALNEILEWGEERNYEWAVFFDQDSIPSDNFIQQYVPHLRSKDTGIICPEIIDINLNTRTSDLKTGEERIVKATDVITSGSCVSLKIAKSIGGFDNRLFIDFVDTDFQERCLRQGYSIVRIHDAILYHEIGKLKKRRFLFFTVLCTNHNAFRRYYMVRNRLYYRRKYF